MGPPEREGSAMASPDGSRAVLFGGLGGQQPYYAQALGDTWGWDGASWTELGATGVARQDGAMAAAQGTLVVFGGLTSSLTAAPETLTWNGATWQAVTASGPASRMFDMMATFQGTVVLFGGEGIGQDDAGTMPLGLEDTWIWDGATWTALEVQGPGHRSRAVMAAL